MVSRHKRVLGVALLALAAAVPLIGTRGGFHYSHENFRYPVLLNLYEKQLLTDGFPVRWLPELAGGYGYPTFVYYPQGVFLLATPLTLGFGMSEVIALAVTAWVCLFVGGLAMYFAGRRLSGESAGGVMSAGLFLLAPWMATEIMVRGDLAEGSALCAGAITLAVALALADENRDRPRRWLRVVGPVVYAAPMVLHPIGGMMAGLVATLVAGARVLERPRERRSWRGLIIANVAGFAMCAWYLVPLATMQDLVHLNRTTEGYYKSTNHIVEPMQLIRGPYGYGGSAPGPGDEMSFALGVPVFVAAFLGFRGRRASKTAAALFGITCLIVTTWFTFLWTDPSPLVRLQFSWRLLGMATLAAAAAASAAGAYSAHLRWKVVAVLIGLIALFQPSRYAAHPRIISFGEAHAIVRETAATLTTVDERFAGSNEFDPRGIMGMAPLGTRSVVTDAHGPVPYRKSGSRFDFQVSRAQGAEIRVAQYYFPGWVATVDGVELPEVKRLPEGLIGVSLPAGPPAQVSIRYAGVALDKWLVPLAAVTPLAVLLISWRRR